MNQSLMIEEQAKELACGEQPQARFENFGPEALSDSELLALLLQNGMSPRKALDTAQRLMAEAGTLTHLAAWPLAQVRRMEGVGPVKARQLKVVVEIARRMMTEQAPEPTVLNKPALIHAYMRPRVMGLEVEKFWVLCLNRKNCLKKLVEVTSGTATSSLAHPREVFRSAIEHAAAGVVCVHNHPSGDPAPSAADVQVTRQLRDAARAVDIELLDHVIVGEAKGDPRGLGYYSFREAGIL